MKKINSEAGTLLRMTLPVFLEYLMAMLVGNIDQMLTALLTSAAISVTLAAFSRQIFGLVTDSAEIIALGGRIMLIDIFLEAGRAGNLTMVRSLQATGDIRFPILLGIASTWVIAVGLSFLLGVKLGFGLAGVWVAMASDEILRATIFLFRWRSGRWKTKKLI